VGEARNVARGGEMGRQGQQAALDVDRLSGLVEDAVEKRLAVLRRAGRDTHRLGG
jgi:hypothetical protein